MQGVESLVEGCRDSLDDVAVRRPSVHKLEQGEHSQTLKKARSRSATSINDRIAAQVAMPGRSATAIAEWASK